MIKGRTRRKALRETIKIVEIYKSANNQWYWRAKAHNNEIVATSGEGLYNVGDADSIVRLLFPGVQVVIRGRD